MSLERPPVPSPEEEKSREAAERIAQASSFDELFSILRGLESVETSQGVAMSAEEIIETIERVRNKEASFKTGEKYSVTRGGDLKIRQKVAELLEKEGIDWKGEGGEPSVEKTEKVTAAIKDLVLAMDRLAVNKKRAENREALSAAREKIHELTDDPETKTILEKFLEEKREALERARKAISENKRIDRLDAREALAQAKIDEKQLEQELELLEETLGGKQEKKQKEKLKREKKTKKEAAPEEQKDLGEAVVEDFEKAFSIRKEELETTPGFNELSDPEKALVLRNLKQIAMGSVQDEAIKTFGEEATQSRLLGRMWRNVWKKYYVAKAEKGSALDLMQGGIAMHQETLTELVRQTKESDILVTAEGNELKINFVGREFERMSDPQKETVLAFNVAAEQFATLPKEWGLGQASKREQEQYKKARKTYEEARASLLNIEKERFGNDVEAQLAVLDIDRKVQMQQFVTSHPEVEGQLEKAASKSAWTRAFQSTLFERGVYAAAGYGVRTATVSMLGLAGLPIAAAAMGGFMAWRRGKEARRDEEKAVRGGKDQELLEQAMQKRREVFREYVEVFKQAQERIEDAKNIPEDPAVKAAKEKMDAAYAEIEAVREKVFGKRKNYENVEKLRERLEAMAEELQTGKSTEGIDLTETQKKTLAKRLKNRIEYTQDKIDKGLVIFGGSEERLTRTYDLLTRIGQAATEVARVEHEEEILRDPKVFERLGAREKKIETAVRKQERKKLRGQVIRGATLGAAFATAGWVVRDYFHEDVSVLKDLGVRIEDPTAFQASMLERELGINSQDGYSWDEALAIRARIEEIPQEARLTLLEHFNKTPTFGPALEKGMRATEVLGKLLSEGVNETTKKAIDDFLEVGPEGGFSSEETARIQDFIGRLELNNAEETARSLRTLYEQEGVSLGEKGVITPPSSSSQGVIPPIEAEKITPTQLGTESAVASSTHVAQPSIPTEKPITSTQEVVDRILKPSAPGQVEEAGAVGRARPGGEGETPPRQAPLGTVEETPETRTGVETTPIGEREPVASQGVQPEQQAETPAETTAEKAREELRSTEGQEQPASEETSPSRETTGITPESLRGKFTLINEIEKMRGGTTEIFNPEISGTILRGEGISFTLYRQLANQAIESEGRSIGLSAENLADSDKVKTALFNKMQEVLRQANVVDNNGQSLGHAVEEDGTQIRIRDVGSKIMWDPEKNEIRVTGGNVYGWRNGAEIELVPKQVEVETPAGVSTEGRVEEPIAEGVEGGRTGTEAGATDAVAEEQAPAERTQEIDEGVDTKTTDGETTTRTVTQTEEGATRIEHTRNRVDAHSQAAWSAIDDFKRELKEREEWQLSFGGPNDLMNEDRLSAVDNLQRELREGWFSFGGPDHNDLMGITARLSKTYGIPEQQSKVFASFFAQGRKMGKSTFESYFDARGEFKNVDFGQRVWEFNAEIAKTDLPITERFVPRRLRVDGKEIFGIVRKTGADQYEYVTEKMRNPQGVNGEAMRERILGQPMEREQGF